eukprot:COSAG06_NODE_14332_length_1166_cov_1.254920_2_plen_155_part_01
MLTHHDIRHPHAPRTQVAQLLLRQVRRFTLYIRAGTSITIALHPAHIEAGWLCHGGLWGAAHRQNIALHAMRGKARGRARAYHLAHNAAQAMSKTAGCFEASTPPTPTPGSGRDESESRSARTGEANKVQQDVEWSRARGRPRVLPAAGAAAGAP